MTCLNKQSVIIAICVIATIHFGIQLRNCHAGGPANPGAAQHVVSLGVGYRLNRFVIDVFYMAGFHEDRTVNNEILSGKYESMTHYAGFSILYTFSAFDTP
jgi:hypothetical protein